MADIDITASFQAGNVEQGFRKVEQGTQRLQRSTRRSGMAFLEATRALEDFQFAGIRGAANNLPGLAMALGLGTGIAGMATLAALGLMQLTKAMKRFEVAVNAGKEQANAFAESLNAAVDNAQNRQALAALEKDLEKVNQRVKEAAEMADYVGGADAQIEVLQREIALERELASLRGEKVNRAEQFEEDAKAAQQAAKIYEQAVASIEARTKSLEKFERSSEAARTSTQDDVEMGQTRLDVARANVAKLEKLVEAKGAVPPDGVMDYIGGGIGNQIRKIFQEETRPQMRERAAKKALEDAKRIVAETKKELAVTKKRYETEEAGMKKLAEAREELAKKREEAERKVMEAQRAAEEAIMKRDAVSENVKSDRLVDLSTPILSSQGRAGLAGNEIQTAMQSLQVERDMLRELKALVKLTRTKTTAWA